MDRYQFEDLISDYLENNLSLSQRKEFEAYLEAHPEAATLVESVRNVIHQLGALPEYRTSPGFMPALLMRMEKEQNRPVSRLKKSAPRTYFGFTPVYAGLFATALIALIVVSIELIPERPGPVTAKGQVPPPVLRNPDPFNAPEGPLTAATTVQEVADTARVDDQPVEQKTDYQKRITLVKDQH